MKNTLSLTSLLMLLTTLFTFAQSGEVSRAKPVTQQRSVGSFDRITVQNAIQVFITPGDPHQIELTSEADQLNEVITRVKGNELTIEVPKGKLLYDTYKNAKGQTTRDSKPISVTLHVNTLRAIHLETACSLTIDTPVDVDQLTVVLRTASTLTTSLSLQTLWLSLDAASRANLSGSVSGEATLTLEGASRLQADALRLTNATIALSGSSQADVQVRETLRATADGVSRLTYSGNPTVQSAKATGLSTIDRN